MEFFKSLVPTSISISGDAAMGHHGGGGGGGLPRDTGPRLLRMKRLGLLAMGHAIEEDEPGTQPGGTRPPRTNRSRLKGNP